MPCRRAMRRIPGREPGSAAGSSHSTAVAVVPTGHCGPDPFHDLVGFVLGDLDELVLQVAAFGGNQLWAKFPVEIPGEYFVGSTTILGVGTPEHPRRLVTAAQVIHDG